MKELNPNEEYCVIVETGKKKSDIFQAIAELSKAFIIRDSAQYLFEMIQENEILQIATVRTGDVVSKIIDLSSFGLLIFDRQGEVFLNSTSYDTDRTNENVIIAIEKWWP